MLYGDRRAHHRKRRFPLPVRTRFYITKFVALSDSMTHSDNGVSTDFEVVIVESMTHTDQGVALVLTKFPGKIFTSPKRVVAFVSPQRRIQ